MTFSEFAKMLYPYCGNEMKTSDFVFALTDAIMEEVVDDENYADHNPLKKLAITTIEKYFNGGANISQKNASAIVGRLYSENFSEYVNKLSPDALSLLSEDLNKRGIDVSGGSVGDICAELFKSIIKELADGKSPAATVVKLSKPSRYKSGEVLDDTLAIESDISFLMEANGVCPKCGKPLVVGEGNNSLRQYKIVSILPQNFSGVSTQSDLL